MKKKIAWITDTSSTLSKEFIEENNIYVVPLHIILNDVTYSEGVDLTNKGFYDLLREQGGVPKTSQASLGEFVTLYEKLKEEYEVGIAIHLSTKLSGTLQTSLAAADMAEFKIHAVDSKIGAYPLNDMIATGIEMEKDGHSVEEILEEIEKIVNRSYLYFSPMDLEQFHRSGRVSSTKAFIGNLLKIKLIFGFMHDDGRMEIVEKIRTEKKLIQWFVNKLQEIAPEGDVTLVKIYHCEHLEGAKTLESKIKEVFPHVKTEIGYFLSTVGAHTGLGTLGITWTMKG